MPMKKMSERPFELVGFTYNDYHEWCAKHSYKEKDVKSKKKFFKLIYQFKLIKKDGKVIEFEEEIV